jgi:hypothetical protein
VSTVVPDESTDQDAATPDCTVRFDDRAGCGINVARRSNESMGRFIDLAFVTHAGSKEAHSITFDQAEQLRAVLDSLIRNDIGADEVRHIVVGPVEA